MPKEWKALMIEKCPAAKSAAPTIFADVALTKSGSSACILGAYLGIILDSLFLPKINKKQQNTTILQKLMQISLTFLGATIFMIPYYK